MQTFWVEKAYKLFSARVGSQLVTSLIILFCWVHNFCTHLPLYWWKSNKIYKQIPKQANNKDIEMAGNSELLTSRPWCNMGRKRKCLGNAEVYCVVSMNICCVKLTENLGLKSSVIIKLPWWLFRSVIPWFITWSYLFKSWIIFGALRVLLSKFRKSLEVKISLESFNAGRFLSMVEGLLQHQFVRKSNLGLNLYWSIPQKRKVPLKIALG